jgi:hypothetical protein
VELSSFPLHQTSLAQPLCPYVTPLLLPQFSERELAESDRQGAIRAEAVKGAMLHVWSGYREKAWGTDEVRPKSGSGRATWGGTLLRNASRLAVHSSHYVLSRVGLMHVVAGSNPGKTSPPTMGIVRGPTHDRIIGRASSPLSRATSPAGMGMTMLDALDTMWIMGMKEEFKEAQDWLAKNIDFDRVKTSVSQVIALPLLAAKLPSSPYPSVCGLSPQALNSSTLPMYEAVLDRTFGHFKIAMLPACM